uniref:E3 ubiquitin-protein ligase RNF181 n=1 Tax=Oncorhynchus kisutch TaxID=8019 RepID=A0A8C7CSC9_ONCKI
QVAALFLFSSHLPPPAAKTAVQTLPVVVISSEQAGMKCPVCLLDFEEQETVREMPGKHPFHSGCILPWLRKANSCLNGQHQPVTKPCICVLKDKRKQREHRLEYLHVAMYT